MTRPFKPGDRVKLMGYARRIEKENKTPSTGPFQSVIQACDGKKVTVRREYFATVVFFDGGYDWEIYKSACRKLKPKAKPREWELTWSGREFDVLNGPKLDIYEKVLVREVRRRRK